ncbi:MAG: RNA-binding transcriptional accessory protein [Bacteroidia bacterium]|nr:RNA-binding transcriptional accessory protein [Bacteroidia bacterium]
MKDLLIIFRAAGNLKLETKQVTATINLLDEGATIPFISRYRKELTGSLDEVQIKNIRDEVEKLRSLENRREVILKSIEGQGKLTPELQKQLEEAETIQQLEDLYLPYKPKRRTKATIAREKGLEPLALKIFSQENFEVFPEALLYVDKEKDVKGPDEALNGARDIMAEMISEDAIVREKLRTFFQKKAVIKTKVIKGKEEAAEKFKDYFDWEEPLSTCPSHRMLAMRRGEKEDFLILDISPPEEEAVDIIEKLILRTKTDAAVQVKVAIEDCYKRLLQPSIEAETRSAAKKTAEDKAIEVFAGNIRELLLSPPLGQKAILALDPGFRSGCKVVALNKQGKLLEHTVIYPHEPQRDVKTAESIVLAFCMKHNIEAIAIGNGTAGRETEAFIRKIDILPKEISVIMVNESGASVYSASDVAREEFPNEDVTVRGAVSIGRRLADPLAELVKIDPKAIGVGQYQHDVDQGDLKDKLDEVVSSCVNAVGVELNTASKELLTYVSGLGPQLAQNIVKYRNENGPFKTRKDLMNVARMGEKVFEQCAGFLRIRNGHHALDKSAVHPESYSIVEAMARDNSSTVDELMTSKDLRKRVELRKYVNEKVGLPTLTDIIAELEKPGRDPRKSFETFSFAEGINEPEDLRVGMKLQGIVTNVTNFGAFVDIGVHQDGLVHISQLSDTFVDDPNKIVKVQQIVKVTVTEVDLKRKRIALSMKSDPSSTGIKSTFTPKEEIQYDSNDMNSALNALKKKFGK